MMNLTGLGEFGLINRIKALACAAAPAGMVGIGDDCAVIPVSAEKSLLVTGDMLLAGRHFLADHIPPRALGHKSLAVNLSDIAAMGGQPLYVFLSLALPAATPVNWLDEFMAGFSALAVQHGIILMGGDTCRSENITINVTVIGEAHPAQIKYRHTARFGDVICVTGKLGDSGAGLHTVLKQNCLGLHVPLKEEYISTLNFEGYLIHQHYYPQPHLAQGQFLAGYNAVHAMIDISDGLASDLTHIIKASQTGARIDIEALPLSFELNTFAQAYDFPAESLALTAGEDYCLLVTVAADAYVKISTQYTKTFGQLLHKIGEITAGHDLQILKNGQSYQPTTTGFDHFR